MKNNDYPILLVYSKEDEAWLARVDLLPGCIVDGATPEEALENAKVAIEDWVETCKALGRPVPPPLDQEQLEQAFIQQQQALQNNIQMLIGNAIAQYHQFMSSAGSKSWGALTGSGVAQLQGERPTWFAVPQEQSA
jgi:predicted RNase H-like HicB family nuclease